MKYDLNRGTLYIRGCPRITRTFVVTRKQQKISKIKLSRCDVEMTVLWSIQGYCILGRSSRRLQYWQWIAYRYCLTLLCIFSLDIRWLNVSLHQSLSKRAKTTVRPLTNHEHYQFSNLLMLIFPREIHRSPRGPYWANKMRALSSKTQVS